MAVTGTSLQFLLIVSVKAYDQLVKPGTTVATTSTTYFDFVASRAIDGDFNQDLSRCSHTDDQSGINEAWLRIDLKRRYSLMSVKFWYRNNGVGTGRLPGYSIRVSNNSVLPPQDYICYQDSGNTTLTNVIEHKCWGTAQYVWIYQNNTLIGICPMLEICEVQIFGCQTGRYGDSCSKNCDHCQNNDYCGIVSGKCDESGCSKKNFVPPFCEDCRIGYYGSDCSLRCGEWCLNDYCNMSNGECFHGCDPGYQGPYCNKTCPGGRYGAKCAFTCGNCFNKDYCHYTDGECEDGCDKGFKGKLCKTPCNDGEYGMNCVYPCSGNCMDEEVCDKLDGHCSMCADGFESPRCNKKCNAGKYGKDCSLECGHCQKKISCNHINGSCPIGCEPGWHATEKCDTLCHNGTFGLACKYNCSDLCSDNQCDRRDGSCLVCNPAKSGSSCSQSGNGQDKVEVIVISVILIIVLIITALVACFVYRRTRRTQKHSPQNIENDNVYHLPDIIKDENEYEELSTDHGIQTYRQQSVSQNGSRKCNMSKGLIKHPDILQSQTKAVMILDLLSRIRELEQNSNKGFLREFDAIGTNISDHSCKVGMPQENITKSRNATTLPYDLSRVVLQSTLGNYDNAHFIKNMNGETTYIASQEPTRKTVSDFWQMVWQEKVYVIAMMVTIANGSQKKSQKYWPNSIASDMNQGIFMIHLKSEKIYSAFTIREFLLIEKKTREGRQIRHLQFTMWPECGRPHSLDLLVYYRYVSKAMEKHSKSTLLVHCSSGSGPTAVIIALDALYNYGLKTGMVNIADFVGKMRMNRMNMIENLEQYICLYRVLYECFRANVGVLDKDRFLTESTHEHVVNEFYILSSIKPSYVDVGDSQTRDGSTEYQHIMKHEGKANVLQSSAGTEQVLQCNAIMLPSFTTKDCIITGRYPSHGEAVDLIHLLINQRCSTLVSVNPLSEVPYFKEWFFQSVEVQDCQVEVTPVAKMSKNVTLSTLRAKRSMDKNYHQLTVYELTSWKYSENIPRDIDAMLDVIKSVQLDKDVNVNKKLVILSKDGAAGCGVFCAVYNAIQQLQQDEEVDMFTIVRQLQSRRPEMISDMSDYLCCYNAVKRYLERN